MILLIDAGNTNIVFALSKDGKSVAQSWRCKTDTGRTADEYAVWLRALFAEAGIDPAAVTGAILSSVVPDANFNLLKLCRETFGVEPLVAGAALMDFKINLKKPEEAGADRLVNAVAVIRDYGCPAVVVDFGTATTFDVVNGKGEFCGGAIAPGINLSLETLHRAAARLPKIDVSRAGKAIGTDTVEAMQSGIYWGYVGLIEGLLTRIEAELGEKPLVIATGGLAVLFADTILAIEKVDNDLTLRGLLHIYRDHGR